MKKLFAIITTSLLLSTFIISCNKNRDNTTGYFNWTFMGTSHTADVYASYLQSVALAPHNIVAITGTNVTTSFTRKVSFSLSSFNSGNYTMNIGGNTMFYIDEMGFNHAGVSGTITLTNTNNRLSGGGLLVVAGPSSNNTISVAFNNVPIYP